MSTARMVPAIKLYGERHTGTNYLERLLLKNFSVGNYSGNGSFLLNQIGNERLHDLYFRLNENRTLGWKHRYIDDHSLARLIGRRGGNSDLIVICTVRHPISWALSMHRMPYHAFATVPQRFDEFVQMRWDTRPREHLQSPSSLIDLWNQKTRALVELHDRGRAMIVRFEDLVVDFEAVLTAISTKFGLAPKTGHFVDIDRSTKRDGRTTEQIRDHYQSERWRAGISADAWRVAAELADPSVSSRLGYLLSPQPESSMRAFVSEPPSDPCLER